MDESTTIGLVEDNGEIGSNANTSENPETHMPQSFPSTSEAVEKTQGARKNYKRTANRGRKGSQVLASRKCSLRSPQDNVRALRSLSNVKKAPNESVDTPIQPAAKRRKRARPSKRSPKNEYLTIRQRVRYILNRMSYEQSLIEAYASEGWKGQSLEKVRPEKELERAKAEILRCKLRIREAFQNIDSLLSDGKLEESLFDSAGEISSEDIFCAKCCSKDVTLSNDIILCDGVCDRGFHQNCLDPPLLTEDIPAGDEGWLCPACDCKIDCIDVLNELQGSDLSIHDSWEKVFPEVAVLANGLKQNDTSDLPSEDSDDNDYDPNMAEEHVVDQEKEGSSEEDEDEGSDSDDSNFTGSSENSEPPKDKKTGDDLGLPSEDSEDDDYDPAVPDSDKDIKKHQSSSDKSDFTSDLDDFCAEITKSCGQADVSTPLSGVKAVDNSSDTARDTIDTQAKAANSNVTSMETELNQDVILPVSRRRQIERLDYKKLYDEAYGKASPDSSDDDEDWCGKSTPQKDNKQESETDSPAQKSSRTAGVALQNGLTPQSAHQCLPPAALDGSVGEQRAGELTSNGSNSTAQKRHFGPTISQRLQEHFKTDPYPTRTTKETLAQEIGLTYRQVNKWFESTRHYTRVATAKNLENHTTKKNSCSETMMEQLNVGRNDITNEETMARNLNESSKQDSPVKQDINYEHGVVLALFSNQSPASTSRKVGRPRGGFRKNLG